MFHAQHVVCDSHAARDVDRWQVKITSPSSAPRHRPPPAGPQPRRLHRVHPRHTRGPSERSRFRSQAYHGRTRLGLTYSYAT